MTSSSAALRELHRLHRFARELQEQIDRGPRQLKAHEDKVARHEQSRTDAQDALKKLKVAIHEKEVALKAKHQQIAKYEQQRNQATTRKEYDALQHEIAHDRQECSQLEDQILEVMLQAENRANEIPVAEEAVAQAKAELARCQAEFEPRSLTLREEIAKTTAQLQEQERQLSPNVIETYQRLVAAMGEDALALVANRNCTACHTAITIQHHNDLLSGRMVLCKSCGRMLYLEPQAPPADS